MELYEQYCKLSTRKRIDGMANGTKIFIKRYLDEYTEEYDSINKKTFIEYLVNKNLQPSTKAVIAIGLGRYLKWAGYINEDDYKSILQSFRSPIKEWSNISLNEQDIIEAIKMSGYGGNRFTRRRNKYMIFLLSSIGMRVSQLVEIKSESVIKDDKYIRYLIPRKKDNRLTIRENLDIKPLPLSYSIGDYVHEDLYNDYMSVKPKDSEYFFVNRNGNMMTTRYVQKVVEDIGGKLGLDLSPHKFRHYVGTMMANSPGGLVKAKILLGHADIRTTLKYVYPESINIWE